MTAVVRSFTDDPPPRPNPFVPLRLLGVAGGLALSAFFFWLAAAMLRAPIGGAPNAVVVASLRAFGVCVFGGIGLLGLQPLANELRGLWLRRRIALAARFCPACGEAREGLSPCARCAYPGWDPTPYWTTEGPMSLVGAGLVAIMAGVASLGVFMIAGSLEPHPGWSLLCGVALGLLLLATGVPGTVAAARQFVEQLGEHSRSGCAFHWSVPGGSVNVSASLVTGAGAPRLTGVTTTTTTRVAPTRTRSDDGFARGLAVSIARATAPGDVRLRRTGALRWSRELGPSASPAETASLGAAYRGSGEGASGDPVTREESARWWLSVDEESPRALDDALDLACELPDDRAVAIDVLRATVRASPALRARVEARDPGPDAFGDPALALALTSVVESEG